MFLDAAELGVRQRVGTLFRHESRTDLPASFEYDSAWLEGLQVISAIAKTVGRWREEAARVGLPRSDVARMEAAFNSTA